MGESSAVKATRLANEANIQNTRETNQANKEIAESANRWNYQMFQEQNAWNREQWKLENEYNSPAQQVQRYIEAGINPIWAIANGNPGNAQQLTSASAAPAEVATMQTPTVVPEADPTRLNNIVAAANNVVNNLQGFMKLALEQQDVNTRSSAQKSTEALNLAEGMFKRSQTHGQNILNNLNTETYSYQVSTRAAEYHRLLNEIDNLKKQGKNIDAVTLNLEATRDQINAQTDYIFQQKSSLIEQVAQGWRKLAIEQQNANTSQFSAQSQSYYEGQNLQQRHREYSLEADKAFADFSLKSNSQILDWINNQRGVWEKFLGLTDSENGNINLNVLIELQAAGKVLSERVAKNPNQDNIQSFNEWQRSVQSLPLPPSVPNTGNLQNFSIINP